jgi:hypothetical protein
MQNQFWDFLLAGLENMAVAAAISEAVAAFRNYNI